MKKGSALIIVIVIVAVWLTLAALTTKIVYNHSAGNQALLERGQAFYLAEAGLEKGKVALAHNPNWYTDLAHYPEDNVDWLRDYSAGQKVELANGWFKLVREKGQGRMYSIGQKGAGVVILKLTFTNPPLANLAWREL